MNRIKSRRIETRRRKKLYAVSFGFCLLGIVAAGFEFMLWYFVGIPTWLFTISEIGCFALIVDGLYIYDALEEEKAPLWDRHDI